MKSNCMALLVGMIALVQAGTTADGVACTQSTDCVLYVPANPTAGSVCNPCVFGSNLVYLCVNYATAAVPTLTTGDYSKYEISCRVK